MPRKKKATSQNTFDFIIVGGRVSGSALAARLALYGYEVLLLERETFPSLPAVSSPIIYASTMRILDEIGADEDVYARDTPRIHHMSVISRSGQVSQLRIPDYKGRNYAYAIDRARFDEALWQNAISKKCVTGYQGFSVTDLLWDDDGRVVGVTGKDKQGESCEFRASAVIGADGRFSMVARKVNASTRDEHDEHPTSIYYAYWRDVPYLEGYGATAAAYEADDAFGYLVMDSADGQAVIAIEGRSDTLETCGDAEKLYIDMLKRNPYIWRRIQESEMVTSVRGMRNISNAYRQAGGAGWALVGDAYHQKDPLDGQGIYNAVITGKALAQALRRWRDGDYTWEEAIADYDRVARIKTFSMYQTLQTRVRTSFYSPINDLPLPTSATDTLTRWITEDDAVNDLMGKMLTRQLPPEMINLLAPPTMLGAVAKGSLRDARRWLEKRLPIQFVNDETR
jgi:flavin-dependent dehydrogenase